MVADLLHHAHLMGDDDHGDAQLAVDLTDKAEDLLGGAGIEGRGGLVTQQHLGIGGQRTGDGHTLLLTAGELGGIGLGLIGQAHQLQQFVSPFHRLFLAYARQFHGETDVLQARPLHQQIEVLEDHGDLPPRLPQLGRGHGVQTLSVDHHFALRGTLQ